MFGDVFFNQTKAGSFSFSASYIFKQALKIKV